jgi:excisionase family DNA binding protein
MTNNVPQLLTLVEVAEALCLSPHTIRSWVKKGRLRPTRICRRLIFHPHEIERFLAENSAGSKNPTDSRSATEVQKHAI